MGYLSGLTEYLGENYGRSVFDEALSSKKPWEMHVHGRKIITATVLENLKYDVNLQVEGKEGQELLQKHDIKCLYPADTAESVRGFVKTDPKVMALGLEPVLSLKERRYVKNKSLFPLMKGKEVVFFTLLEGEVVRGVIAGFTRYDITVHMKGRMPVVILRHAVHDLRNKKDRCFLKSSQEERRDWQKSPLFVSE
jgi:sRNA-binding regulator protein Hfq